MTQKTLITVETLGKTIENQFFIYGSKCKKKIYFLGIWGALGGGGINDQNGSILVSSYPPIHIYVHDCEIRKQSDKNFWSSSPKIWGALTSTV